MGKSGRKKVSFWDKEHEVGKANSFKTIEDTNNKSISFKTFDDWVKAKTAHCDMALKYALNFVSDKKSAVDGEKDSQWARPAQPTRSNPTNTESSSLQTDNPSDPQQPRETPAEKDLHGCRRGESTMEPMRTQQPRETPMDRGEILMECRIGEFTMEPRKTSPCSPGRGRKATSTAVHHRTKQDSRNQGNEQCSNTNWPLSRPFGSRTQRNNAYRLLSRPFIPGSSWQFEGMQDIGTHWLISRAFTDGNKWLPSRPSQRPIWRIIIWLLSRPLWFIIKLTPFKTLECSYATLKHSNYSFQDPSTLHGRLPSGN